MSPGQLARAQEPVHPAMVSSVGPSVDASSGVGSATGAGALGREQKRGVRVTMEPDDLTVDPGSEVTTKVTVRNIGTRVEEFELVAQGPGAVFASVIPATLSIYPDVEQRAVVRFAPPRGPQSPAGVTTFEIVARSVVHSDVSDVARGRLTVTPFQELSAVLTPDVSRGRRPVRHLVSVTNGGNTPVSAQLALKDQDSVLTFAPREGTAALRPGDKVDLPVLINGPRRWFGRTERLPFSAVVTPTSADPPITLNGTRQQTPVFPWWMPAAAVTALAMAIGVYALLPTAKVPSIPQIDEVAAVTQLKDAGYIPDVIRKGDDGVAKGLAITTEPAAGSEFKHGEHVKLFVSLGKCAGGPCPVEVPNVVGKSVDEATTLLEGLKFRVRIDPDKQPNDERPVDHVIASNPAAPTSRPPDSDVTLTLSSGPKETKNPGGGALPVVIPPPPDKKDTPPPDKKDPAQDKKDPSQDKNDPSQDKNSPTKPLKLPDLKGGSVADATAALAKLGLTVKTVQEHSNAVPSGKVISSKPDADSEVKPGSEVALTVAQNTVSVDLIATAGKAIWTNGSGKTLDFPGKESDKTGFVQQRVAKLGDSPSAKVLETHPQDTGAISGEYTLAEPAVAGDHIVARVGLLQDTTGAQDPTGGQAEETLVTFQVEANNKPIKTVTVSTKDSKLQKIDADLVEGTKSIQVTVLADSKSVKNVAPVWQSLQLQPPAKR